MTFLFVLIIIWIDDSVNGAVFNACDSGELPHTDTAADGFTDQGLSLLFGDCREGVSITSTQLLQRLTGLIVSHAAVLNLGVGFDASATDVEYHFTEFIPRQSRKWQSPGTNGFAWRDPLGRILMPTAPSILVGAGDHLGLNGVLVNIAQQGDKVSRVTDRLTTETVMEQRAQMAMPFVVVTDIGHTNAFHHSADVFGTLGNEQMDVIIHQAIGVDVAIRGQRLAVAVLGRSDRTKYLEEFGAVLVVNEDVAAINATQHYVVNTGIAMLSALTWHGQRMISLAKIVRFLEIDAKGW